MATAFLLFHSAVSFPCISNLPLTVFFLSFFPFQNLNRNDLPQPQFSTKVPHLPLFFILFILFSYLRLSTTEMTNS